MEYVSIPWKHGTDENNDQYKKLTVNLALWVLHILAGNHHQILGDYPDLHAEKLVLPVSPSENTREVHRKRSRESEGDWLPKRYPQKRKKVEVSPDRIYLSFNTDVPFGTEVRPCSKKPISPLTDYILKPFTLVIRRVNNRKKLKSR